MRRESTILSPVEIRKLTGTKIPSEQVTCLRSHGLDPFICPKSGSPIIYRDVVKACMLGQRKQQRESFELNMEAFE